MYLYFKKMTKPKNIFYEDKEKQDTMKEILQVFLEE